MPWLVFWLIAQDIAGSHGCLKCSADAMAVVREFKDTYLDRHLFWNPQLKAKLKADLDNFVEELTHQRIDAKKYMGVIDEFSLADLGAHFKRCLKHIMENEVKEPQLHKEMDSCFQKTLTVFHELLPRVATHQCSNECGVMVYVFTHCFSCLTRTYTCNKKYYCGERRIQVEMDEDLVLDCALQWHKLTQSVKKYNFYRVVNGKLKPMSSSMDSFLVKKEVNVNDTGRYRCDMVNSEDFVSSYLDFLVQVVPAIGKTTWFPRPSHTTMTVPLALGISSRAPPPQADFSVWIVIGGTGGLFVFILLAFLFAYFRRKREEEDEEDDDDDESESGSSELVAM
ncbi:izumo sperm-egg fusion protein 1 [Zootoca vivipara]|uniref:izumo sperm-egg fusion protein 1 n=1 Tax=Zootoca vivipara TaxID=8524 RepID=UPI00293BE30E|nr:izumo sperm-egg fusion protein 1 [Zootoca vivipara]